VISSKGNLLSDSEKKQRELWIEKSTLLLDETA
jgi:hypothetical protein